MSGQRPPEPVEVTLARIAGVSEQINARLENVVTRLGNLEHKLDAGFVEARRELALLRNDLQFGANRLSALLVVGILIQILLAILGH